MLHKLAIIIGELIYLFIILNKIDLERLKYIVYYIMELVENLPILKVNYLKEMSFKEFKKFCSSNAKSEEERKKQYDIIQGFCKSNIKSRGQMTRIYSFTQKTPLEVGGRLYCGNSLQSIGKQFRGFLCDEITTDIDMKNAHPTIARYLCKLHGIPCPNLAYYIDNRDEILAQFGSDGKELFLKALNDDKLNKKEKNKIYVDFDKECKFIQKAITEIPEYSHIVNSVPDTKLYNWLGSAFNRIMCVYENKILHSLISILNQKQITVCSLAFDGLLMYGNYYKDLDLLQKITAFIETDWIGLNMKWAYKAHITDIVMPDEWEIPKPTNETGVWNDVEATELVYQLYPHWVYCLGELYVYDKSTGKWDTNDTSHLRVIITLTDKLFVLINDKDGNAVRTKNSYGNNETLMKRIPKLIKTLCEDNNWIDIQQYSSLGKILFTNGYYDFKKSMFFKKGEFGFDFPEILFMNRINRSFEPFDDDDIEYIESIKQRFFHNPLGVDMGNYMALNLARGLAGDKMKRIIFGLGGTNCGKSVLTTACRLSCGEYVGSFNAENLAYKQSSADEAAIMRWAMLSRFKRLLFSNEVKNTTDLNGNMIKKISSGGDSIVARCHGGNETEFILHFLAVIMANDVPKIKPYDDAVNERCKVFGYNKQFVEDPSNEFELLMDKNIELEMLTDRFQWCFLGLLIRAYLEFADKNFIELEPIEAHISKQDWIQEEKSYIVMFKNDYELTNCVDDFVTSADMLQWIEEHKLGISFTKFALEMNKFCKINKLTNVHKKDKKIQGKCKTIWTGIKHMDDLII